MSAILATPKKVPARPYTLLFIAVCTVFFGCYKSDTLFTLMPASRTGIDFANMVTVTATQNPSTNHSFYDGGGVAVGDINNDGLPDIFFCSSEGQSKLYLNKGNFRFEDITMKAGIYTDGMWVSGATFADVNGDGLVDLYVCRIADYKVGWRGNQLYINQGNGTFKEDAAKYGLDNPGGASVQAAFFDYDNDGDLDCYLLNNSGRPVGFYDFQKDQRKILDTVNGNKLLRNDGGHFTNVTAQAGIYGSQVGFGLGITVADINKDGWPDIYISNDYFERDYLYLNKHDGTFEECLEKYVQEISEYSMGADIADINNDGYPEIFVTDMLPQDEARIKTKTSFDSWDIYQLALQNGYYKQFLRNTLQLNLGPAANKNGDSSEYYFSEISRYAGVQATDWSWGALVADFDNDGYKDIFVANGMYKDVTDQDFIQSLGMRARGGKGMKQMIDELSSSPIPNFIFHNNGDLTFTNKSAQWGLSKPGFSNGSVYVDLDNDGDLDIVTNDMNGPAGVYRNNAEDLYPNNKYLKVVLQGQGNNRFGFGAKVTVYHDSILAYQEEMPSRGFESCVDSRLNFGLGSTKKIDSVVVVWPNNSTSVIMNVQPNQTFVIQQAQAIAKSNVANYEVAPSTLQPGIFSESPGNFGIDYKHTENDYNDFDKQPLTFKMISCEGPRMAKADVNGDGLEDVFIGGAKGQPCALYIQQKDCTFIKSSQQAFAADATCEDAAAVFFDADGDNDLDLYVCSGGNEYTADKHTLYDRLYINDGKGNFTKSPQVLPTTTSFDDHSCVSAADFDADGDVDLFVGTRVKPGQYGYACTSYILQNDGSGYFTDVTGSVCPGLIQSGMITDAKWFDYDKDGRPDLVVTGEYMPLTVFHNEGGKLVKTAMPGLEKSNGWWNKLLVADVNDDGYPDIIAGNEGLNSRFKASAGKPITMYAGDFDGNGVVEQVICTYNGDKQYPMALRHTFVEALPGLKKTFAHYSDYQGKTIDKIFTAEQLGKVVKLNAYTLQTCVLLNNTKGDFLMKPLPAPAQFSPVYGIAVEDFTGDGNPDILLGGNFYASKPEVGINDASYGVLLQGDGKGNFTALPMQQTNLCVKGAVRDIVAVKTPTKKLLLIAKNNDNLQVLTY
ncbi:MAG TPA: VCBS repeat-containing protein [Chitinophagaceae bacterium]|nr:VCBS repeat-containing protein [Chitinophagaceae bacterium]